ncbi:calcineurin-like phosphoesterase C-terminal domain-containing protein [Mobilicoccus massiliensis]|uniref:calcineurin-like phosphoesterase C-terminal domain-containing protein n=1 Tax=Mobilicoccus massiliensis TaxID=1522310 RepID=UPI0005904F77|nr:calcineurin-like phosphoesterase family protein [Mobilicoccus massiliensis]
MSTVQRRVATAILPLVGLALVPAGIAQADSTPRVDPERKAEVVRDDYSGHVDVVRGKAADENKLTGSVFVDKNRNSRKDKNENGIAGVAVSNGRDIVTTNAAGQYSLPVYDRMTVFVTQPAGYAVPVNEDNIAQFSYNHFPNGSPKLKFGGIAPTGALPKAVNFPMVKSKATAKNVQNCAVASDTQPRNLTELNYAKQGPVRDLMKRTDLGGCGVMLLGDNVWDDLSLNAPMRDIYRDLRGPIRLVAGNHDMDFDAKDDEGSLDTYRAQFGPEYYSYEVGQTHLIGLDNILYNGAVPNAKSGGYKTGLDAQQLEWLKKDLARVPAHKLVVIQAHAPFVHYRNTGTQDAKEVFDALKAAGRTAENTLLIGGHTHTMENLLPGDKREEWAKKGIDGLPFHQIVTGTVSGDWHSGNLDEYGLPYAIGKGGVRPGTLTIGLKGNEFVESYKVRNKPYSHRFSLGVNSPSWREWAPKRLAWRTDKNENEGAAPEFGDLNVITDEDLKGGTWISANFFAASTKATVEVSVDGRAPKVAELMQPAKGEKLNTGWEFADVEGANANLLSKNGNVPQDGTSIWRAQLPESLNRGVHTATVKGTDRHGRVYTDTIRFTVVDERAAAK